MPSELPRDPGSIFGGLLAACIRDDYVKSGRNLATEGMIFVLLGVCSSVVTSYLLSVAGVLV